MPKSKSLLIEEFSTKPQKIKQLTNVWEFLKGLKDGEKANELKGITQSLSQRSLINDKDEKVRKLVSCCLLELFRITAPDPPYSQKNLLRVFGLIISELGGIRNPKAQNYSLCKVILKTLNATHAANLLVELGEEGSELIIELFRCIYDSVSSKHSAEESTQMLNVLVSIFDDFERNEVTDEIFDVVFEPLLAKHTNSAKNNLARNLLQSISVEAQQIVAEIILDAKQGGYKNSDSTVLKDKKNIYELIVQVQSYAPDVMVVLLPILCQDLSAGVLAQRKRTVDVLSKLFCSNQIRVAEKYRKEFVTFLGRFNDKESEIRMMMVKFASAMLKNNVPECQLVFPYLCDRVVDPDGEIRKAVIEAATAPGSKYSKQLVQTCCKRCLDKDPSVRQAAITRLSILFQRLTSNSFKLPGSQGSLVHANIKSWMFCIPTVILQLICGGNKQIAFSAIEAFINHILPQASRTENDTTVTDKARAKCMYWIHQQCVAHDDNLPSRAKTPLFRMTKTLPILCHYLRNFQSVVQVYLNERSTDTEAAENALNALVQFLPNQKVAQRSLPQLSTTKNQTVFKTLKLLTKCPKTVLEQNSIKEKFEAALKTSSVSTALFPVATAIASVAAGVSLLISPTGILHLMNVGKNDHLAIEVVSKVLHKTKGMCSVGFFQAISGILAPKGKDGKKPVLKKRVIDATVELLTLTTDELVEVDVGSRNMSIVEMLMTYSKMRHPGLAKNASKCLCNLFPEDSESSTRTPVPDEEMAEISERFEVWKDECLSKIDEQSHDQSAALQVLTVLSKHKPSLLRDNLSDLIKSNSIDLGIKKDILIGEDDDEKEVAEKVHRFAKASANRISLLVGCVIGEAKLMLPDWEQNGKRVLTILHNILERRGQQFVDDGVDLNKEQSNEIIRVTAMGLLKLLSRLPSLDEYVDARKWLTFSLIMHTNDGGNRRKFIYKLKKLLSSRNLPFHYTAYLVLSNVDPVAENKLLADKTLKDLLERMDQPEHLLPYVIYCIANHPDFETDYEDELIATQQYLICFLKDINLKERNVGLMLHLLSQITSSIDAEEPTRKGIHVVRQLCDRVLKKNITNQDQLRSFDGDRNQYLLPQRLFESSDETFDVTIPVTIEIMSCHSAKAQKPTTVSPRKRPRAKTAKKDDDDEDESENEMGENDDNDGEEEDMDVDEDTKKKKTTKKTSKKKKIETKPSPAKKRKTTKSSISTPKRRMPRRSARATKSLAEASDSEDSE
eukprot:TRINITY_DN10672_c0_g1_i1.p1 TRINITY_DN10672_c0_g1~~TRINITY_DN10672_c0_g1_i1.p1  ORF type:complete len:1239 (-),score=415.41 TRINITY_DN10672_c0_g1_i1:182-3898(-)